MIHCNFDCITIESDLTFFIIKYSVVKLRYNFSSEKKIYIFFYSGISIIKVRKTKNAIFRLFTKKLEL